MVTCKQCQGKGLYPFCDKCLESIDFTIKRAITRNKKVAKARDYEDENLQAVMRYKQREQDKYIIRMVNNSFKVHGMRYETSTATQRETIFGELGDRTITMVAYEEAMSRKVKK